MRIISQDGLSDYSYENAGLSMRKDRIFDMDLHDFKDLGGYKMLLVSMVSPDVSEVIGYFSTIEIAREEMKRIRSAYYLGAKVYEIRSEEEINGTSAIMRTKKKPVKIDLFEPQEEEMKESE